MNYLYFYEIQLNFSQVGIVKMKDFFYFRVIRKRLILGNFDDSFWGGGAVFDQIKQNLH